jgi:hypothetical protein
MRLRTMTLVPLLTILMALGGVAGIRLFPRAPLTTPLPQGSLWCLTAAGSSASAASGVRPP